MSTERLTDACEKAFARHETFHPRYGWLRKSVKAASDDPGVFVAEDATVTLGVGKNMVRAIRYWGQAAHLLTHAPGTDTRSGHMVPTRTGLALFGDDGADPYLEDPGTLWLVHWNLLRPTCEVPAWWLLFHRMTAVEFTEDEASEFITEEVRRSAWELPHPSSITKDVSCLARTYAAVSRGRASIDDIFDCPLRHLGLLEETGRGRFRFNTGRKATLPPEVVLYACLDWMSMQDGAASSASLGRLVHEPGSPGRAFRLAEPAMRDAIESAVLLTGAATLASSAGTTQLVVDGNLDDAKFGALASYYTRQRRQLPFPAIRRTRRARRGYLMMTGDDTRVRINSHFARSANLERDADAEMFDYRVTSRAREVIRRITAGVTDPREGRALSITGTYGSGKSSLAVFLSALLGPNPKRNAQARRILAAADPDLAAAVADTLKELPGRHLLVCAATADREPVAATLLRALRNGVTCLPAKARHSAAVRAVTDTDTASPSELLNLVDGLSQHYGLLIVVDEFGKNIEEFLTSGTANSDLYLLQQIAEATVRKNRQPVILTLLQHLAFADYDPSGAHGREWSKIQGRFTDVPYVESRGESQALMASVFDTDTDLDDWAAHQTQDAVAAGLAEQLDVPLADLYPLHPATAAALPDLCRMYGQNERTLFSFLAGPDSGALPELLTDGTIGGAAHATVRLHHAYDFFLASASTMATSSPHASRWIEIETRLRDTFGLTPAHLRVLKTVGVLNLISSGGPLRASRTVVAYAAADGAEGTETLDAVHNALDALTDQGLVTFREFADEYRIWQGTDFDFKSVVDTARRELLTESVADLITADRPQPPVVAARHSQETGVLRVFTRWFIDDSSHLTLGEPTQDVDGVVLINLGTPMSGRTNTDTDAMATLAASRPVLIGEPDAADHIREAAIELGAYKTAVTRAEASKADWVAVRELRERAAMAGQALDSLLDDLYAGAGTRWFSVDADAGVHPIDPSGPTSISAVLSDICDARFPHTPLLRNEMLSRRVLTSQGAKARRNLLDAMISHTGEPRCGIEGYPPERAMYESLLGATGIHRTRGGHLSFGPPDKADHYKYANAWSALNAFLDTTADEAATVEALYTHMMAPPVGLKEGPIPVLLVAALIARADDVALYETGSFVPRLDVPTMERLIRNPDLFTLRSFNLRGPRQELAERLAEALGGTHHTPRGLRVPSVVTAMSPLVARIRAVPKYALKTRTLDPATRAVRDAITTATEPDTLLFETIPECFGLPAFGEKRTRGWAERVDTVVAGTVQALDNLEAVLPTLLNSFAATISDTVGANPGTLREELRERFGPLRATLSDRSLLPFVSALTDEYLPDDEWLTYVAMIVHGNAPAGWSDDDAAAAQRRLDDLLAKVRNLEQMPHDVPDGVRVLRVGVTSPTGADTARTLWLSDNDATYLDEQAAKMLAFATNKLGSRGAEALLATLTLAVLGDPDTVEAEPADKDTA